MELLQLKYFLELAKYEHLTMVAENMFVSPSAVSSSISRLEDELGVQLFDRVGRNIKLNRYGQEYLIHVKKSLAELSDGEKKLQDMKEASDTVLTLAATNPYVWQNPINIFSRTHPNITFNSFAYDFIANNYKLPSDNVDLLIASPASFSDPSWESQLLFIDAVGLAVPPDHPLAKREKISLIEAKDEWFIALSNSSFSKFCNDLCIEAGFEPKSRITCDYTIRPKIALNEGMVALTTFNTKDSGFFTDMVIIPLEDKNAKRSQAIFWPKGRYLSKPARMLKDFLVDRYKDYKPY